MVVGERAALKLQRVQGVWPPSHAKTHTCTMHMQTKQRCVSNVSNAPDLLEELAAVLCRLRQRNPAVTEVIEDWACA